MAGDSASGLGCNIWALADSPAKLSYQVISGHTTYIPGSRLGTSVLRIDISVLKWKPGRGTPKSAPRVAHPILGELGPKIVHFLVDYHPDWLLSLGLPSSAGNHLNTAGIDSVLDRLEPVNQLLGELQLFTGVKIGHSEYHGRQIVHCAPFKSTHERPRMMRISVYMYVNHANISPYCTYLAILVPVDDILPINLQDYLSSCLRLTAVVEDRDQAHQLTSAGTDAWPCSSKSMCARTVVR